MFANKQSREDDSEQVLTTAMVLEDEFSAIWGEEELSTALGDIPADSLKTRLAELQAQAFARGQAALCLSGGGIRSAAFALGVVQALARKGLLTHFHYLSTVSGGGYIGSFLARWVLDAAAPDPGSGISGAALVARELAGNGPSAPHEALQIRKLRENSNFITPKIGLASADTWSAISISLRNIFINWMIFGPALLIAVLLPHLYSHLVATMPSGAAMVCLAAGAACLSYSVYRGARDLPSHAIADRRPDRNTIVRRVVGPALAWALLAPLALSPVTVQEVTEARAVLTEAFLVPWGAMIGGYLLAICRVDAQDRNHFVRNLPIWIGASAISAASLAAGFATVGASLEHWHNDALTTTGPLLVVVSQLLLTVIYVAFRRTPDPGSNTESGMPKRMSLELDREWVARLSAFKIRPALLWLLLSTCVLILPRLLLDEFPSTMNWLTGSAATLSGVMAIFGGSRSLVGPVHAAVSKINLKARSFENLVAIGTVAFGASLLLFLSRLEVHWAEFLARSADFEGLVGTTLAHAATMILLVVMLWRTSSRINVNRFSLHGLYRNRLARAFLGAARLHRDADPFTGFDSRDNVRMHELAPERGRSVLFPVINIALNVVGGDRLAWQERKAGPFVVTPLACGSAILDQQPSDRPRGAYISTQHYAGQEPDLGLVGTGMSLATAMTISGAAASPNMGYHSSPATAFLMTLFNLRLGAWLPNPARAAALDGGLLRSGPTNALRPLFAEMAGLTDDRGLDVYLSDGGHFENLGLYEMIRRRCRFIVVSDAGCDLAGKLQDLGNAVRKIKIDLDVDITFEGIESGSRDRSTASQIAFAIGRIRYPEFEDEGRLLLYIKPSPARGLPVDVLAYAMANEAFPHEPTSDQWFSESQFESYRALGEHLAQQLGRGHGYDEGGLAAFFRDIEADLAPAASARLQPRGRLEAA